MTTAVMDDLGLAPPERRQPLKSPLTIRELLTPIFYYRRQAVMVFLIPVLLAIAAAMMAKPMYVAQSRLLILLGDEYTFQSGINAQVSGQAFDRNQIVNAEMEILSSRDLRLQTLSAVGLDRVYPDLGKSAKDLSEGELRLGKDLTMENVPQSNVVELDLRNRDPKVAAETLNKLVALYIERRREVFQQADPASMSGERDRLNTRLAEAERALTNFSAQHGFGDYNQELNSVQTQQTTLSNQLQATDQEIAARAARVNRLRSQIGATPNELQVSADAGRSQEIDDMTRTLLGLQTQRRDAAAKFADGYPLVADLDRRIADLQTKIAAAPKQEIVTSRRGLNPVRQQLDTDVLAADSELAGLRTGRAATAASLEATNKRLSELLYIGPEYRQLLKNRGLAEDAGATLAKRTQDAQLSNVLSRSRANVRVIQGADPPLKGKSGRMILLLAGVALGVLAALTNIVLSFAFSEVMVTPGDVEQKIALPILLAVPNVPPETGGRQLGGQAALKSSFIGLEDSRMLMRLLESIPAKGGRVLQLTGAHGGEGTTSLLLDVALIEATRSKRRTLWIDVEPTGGGVAKILASRGASLTALPGDRVMRVDGTQLFVTSPVAEQASGPVDWGKVLDAAREDFELILVDAPPVGQSSAALALAPFVDMTVAVVEAEKTRAAVARNLTDRVEAAGGKIVGAILNKRRFYIPRAIYSWL